MRSLPEFAPGAGKTFTGICTDSKAITYVELVVGLVRAELENLVKCSLPTPVLGNVEDDTHRIPLLREFLVDMLRGLLAQLRSFKGFDQAAGKMLVVPSNLSLTMLLIGIG